MAYYQRYVVFLLLALVVTNAQFPVLTSVTATCCPCGAPFVATLSSAAMPGSSLLVGVTTFDPTFQLVSLQDNVGTVYTLAGTQLAGDPGEGHVGGAPPELISTH